MVSEAPLPMYVGVPATASSNATHTPPNPSAVWKQWRAPNGDVYYGNERTGAVLCKSEKGDMIVASRGSDPNVITNLTANPDTTTLLDMNERIIRNLQHYGSGAVPNPQGKDDTPMTAGAPRGPNSSVPGLGSPGAPGLQTDRK